MMLKKQIALTLTSAWIVLMISCRENIDNSDVELKTQGIYVLNEGSFGTGSGDVSFFDPDSQRVVNNLFAAANGVPAGDVLMDMLIHDTLGILVVNNSNKIRIVNLQTFKLIKDLSVNQPRRIVKVGTSKAYVSCWNGTLKVLDLSSLTLTSSIPMPENYPEGMWVLNHRVYVTLSSGFDWGVIPGAHNQLAVVDALADSVIKTIRVGYNPLEMAYDEYQNRIYVACGGSEFTTPKVHGGIYIVNPVTQQCVDSIITKPGNGGLDTLYVSNIWIEGRYAYFINHYAGPITVFNTQTRLIAGSINGNFFNVAVDSYYEKIWATTMSQNGELKIYDMNFQLLGNYRVGEFPSGIVFRYRK